MRRTWEINTGFFKGLVAVWAVAGFVAFCVVMLIWRSHDRQGHDDGAAWVHSPIHWVLPIWLAPFALAAIVLALYGAALGVRELWRNPPVRRVTRSVTEDLREAHKSSEGPGEGQPG